MHLAFVLVLMMLSDLHRWRWQLTATCYASNRLHTMWIISACCAAQGNQGPRARDRRPDRRRDWRIRLSPPFRGPTPGPAADAAPHPGTRAKYPLPSPVRPAPNDDKRRRDTARCTRSSNVCTVTLAATNGASGQCAAPVSISTPSSDERKHRDDHSRLQLSVAQARGKSIPAHPQYAQFAPCCRVRTALSRLASGACTTPVADGIGSP